MKSVYCKMLLLVLLVAGRVCVAQQPDASTNNVPSQAEIDAFVSRHEGADGVLELTAAFRLPTFPPAAWRLYMQNEKIPYHLTAVLRRSGRMVLEGDIEVFIVDAEGKLVDRVKEPILNLCPS